MTWLPEAKFGTAVTASPDWRKSAPDDGPDDDAPLAETPADVVAMLGFDPAAVAEPDVAEDAGLAFDRSFAPRGGFVRPGLAFDDGSSVRTYDSDGRLHVALANISKAAVNPYVGHEIPGWKDLGLEPDKVYRLLRDPEELARGAASFNGIQLLIKHVPVTADDPQQWDVVGCTGTNAGFEAPYLRNELVIWTQAGIEAVESNRQKELSSAYRYVPDMTPGSWEGQQYDGVMRNIEGNHVALVEEGRAGSDVVVGDSKHQQQETKQMADKATPIKVQRRFATTCAALAYNAAPRLAMDQKVTAHDFAPAFVGVTGKNYPEKRPAIIKGVAKALSGKLAKDEAGPDDVALALIQMIDGGPGAALGAGGAPPEAGAGAAGVAAPPAMTEEGTDASVVPGQGAMGPGGMGVPQPEAGGKGKSFDEGALREHLKSKGLDDEAIDQACAVAGGKPAAEDEEGEGEKKGAVGEENKEAHAEGGAASDEPPEFPGMPKTGGEMVAGGKKDKQATDEEGKMKDMVSKGAMDAAIKATATELGKKYAADTAAAIKAATEAEKVRQREVREAEAFVRPWIGAAAPEIAFDSAAAVFEAAFKALNVPVEGVDPSAYRTILGYVPKPGEQHARAGTPTYAADAAAGDAGDFAKRHPEAARIGFA